MALFRFGAALAAASPAFAGPSLSSCGTAADVMQNVQVSVSPDPIVKGEPFTVHASGSLGAALDAGSIRADLEAKVVVMRHTMLDEKITNTSTFKINPALPAGDVSIDIGPMSLPKDVPGSADVQGKVVMVNGEGKQVACVSMDFHTALFAEAPATASLIAAEPAGEVTNGHYERPPCQDDEAQASIQGASGVLCAPKCAAGGECPADVPEGTTAKPQCVLRDQSGNKYCALMCRARGCPKGASCSALGVCVYPGEATATSAALTLSSTATVPAAVPASEESNGHYERPPCQDDEAQASIQGASGVLCAPKCASGGECPADVPEGTTAKPQCVLRDQSGNKYCALMCRARGCPKGASCSSLGVCVFPEEVNANSTSMTVSSPAVVGEGEHCHPTLSPEHSILCAEGFVCERPRLGASGVCVRATPTVVGEGDHCHPTLSPEHSIVCEKGFVCDRPRLGASGVCVRPSPTVVGEGEHCHPTLSPKHSIMCAQGFVCERPRLGASGVCVRATPTVVGEGDHCHPTLSPEHSITCAQGFVCERPRLGASGVCVRATPTVVGEGDHCHPTLSPEHSIVCAQGFVCERPRLGSSGFCVRATPTVVGEGEHCHPTLSPEHSIVCAEGFECERPRLGSSGVCVKAASFLSAVEPPTKFCGKDTDHLHNAKVAITEGGVTTVSGSLDEAVSKMTFDAEIKVKVGPFPIHISQVVPVAITPALRTGDFSLEVGPASAGAASVAARVGAAMFKPSLTGQVVWKDEKEDEITCVELDSSASAESILLQEGEACKTGVLSRRCAEGLTCVTTSRLPGAHGVCQEDTASLIV